MADYGIMLSISTIKGNVTLADYKDQIGVVSLSWSGSAFRAQNAVKSKGNISVTVTPVTLLIHSGKWTAELLNALYNNTDLGQVTITQIGQADDNAAKQAPQVIQKIVLDSTMVSAVSQGMEGGGSDRMAQITLEYTHILHTVDTKNADFTLKNFTSGAV